MQDNTTPKQKREAMISLLGKTLDEFLENSYKNGKVTRIGDELLFRMTMLTLL